MNLATSNNLAIYRSNVSRWSPMLLTSRSRLAVTLIVAPVMPVFRRCDFLPVLAAPETSFSDCKSVRPASSYRHHHGQSVGWSFYGVKNEAFH